jgi:hypothetical protein
MEYPSMQRFPSIAQEGSSLNAAIPSIAQEGFPSMKQSPSYARRS